MFINNYGGYKVGVQVYGSWGLATEDAISLAAHDSNSDGVIDTIDRTFEDLIVGKQLGETKIEHVRREVDLRAFGKPPVLRVSWMQSLISRAASCFQPTIMPISVLVE